MSNCSCICICDNKKAELPPENKECEYTTRIREIFHHLEKFEKMYWLCGSCMNNKKCMYRFVAHCLETGLDAEKYFPAVNYIDSDDKMKEYLDHFKSVNK